MRHNISLNLDELKEIEEGNTTIYEYKNTNNIKKGDILDLNNASLVVLNINESQIETILVDKVNNAILTDSSICPTCFNKEYDGIIYGDNSNTLVYEDDLIECFLVGNPRAKGHMAISSVKHYKDMMDIDDDLCDYVFKFAKKSMNIIKEIYKSESVYLCTMCDGPMNHFHIQLIPRYKEEKRGSTNFVKERQEYVFDKEKFLELKERLSK